VLGGCGGRARLCWARLWRNAKLEERAHWSLNSLQRDPVKENHKAEETANGKVGPRNQYTRYFDGLRTLHEQLIPRGRLAAETLRGEQHGRRL
jgi:hypothetical protein